MSIYNGPPRPGARGGRDQFNWENVKADKDREFYLGHSVKALTGRWQKGRDVYWYNKEKSNRQDMKSEIDAVKAREEQLMLEALGIKPKTISQFQNPRLTNNELNEIVNGRKNPDEVSQTEETKFHEEHEGEAQRVKGLGYSKGCGVLTMNSGTFKTVLPGEGIEQESLRQVNAKLPLSYPSTNVRSSGLLDIESKKRSEKVSKHIPKEEKRKHKEERRREKKLRREKEKHRGNDYSLEEKLKKQRNKRSRENDSENSDSNDSQRSDSNSENDQHNNDYYLQKVRERRGADTNSFREDEEEPSQRNSIYDSKASGRRQGDDYKRGRRSSSSRSPKRDDYRSRSRSPRRRSFDSRSRSPERSNYRRRGRSPDRDECRQSSKREKFRRSDSRSQSRSPPLSKRRDFDASRSPRRRRDENHSYSPRRK
mmetsp:Transcript_31266/g.56755  ORF Transcript_31266/g.56755 Transcript_31266/m.56755 type:complete len:425 (-) Transcript_31266:276-1550(-)